jgi:peptidyl-dipeptidase Dcp
VLDGAFTIASKLYGLTFTEVFIDKYQEVTTEVTDEKSELVAIFTLIFSKKRKT